MTFWRNLAVLLSMIAIIGCGGRSSVATAPKAEKKAKKPEKAEPKKIDIPPVEVKPDEFPSVEAALTELENVLKMPDGEEHNRAEIRVQTWVVMQGDKAVPMVAARAGDSGEDVKMRITLCRILGKLGSGGTDTLLAVAEKGESNQLRYKAIQTLGAMTPVDKKTIDCMITLLDDKDTMTKYWAIDSLKRFGEPAKAASSKLSNLRQNHEDESIRVSAGEALKKVDPRKTFVD